MAIRLGKGDLCGITLKTESSYGVTNTSDSTKTHAGVMSTLSAPDNVTYGEVVTCGSRFGGTPYVEKRDPTAKVKFTVGKDVDWTMWYTWAFGGASMSGNSPSSKTMLCKVSSSVAEKFTGAMVNKLVMTSTELGGKVEMDAEIYARLHTQTGITDCASISTQSPLRAKEKWTWNGASLPSGNWSLTIDQKLQKVAGSYGEVTLASGEEPYLGDSPEITLEVTIPAGVAPTLEQMRLSDIISKSNATLVLGSKRITLTQAYLTGNLPDRQSGQYDDKLVFKASNVTISTISG